MNIHDWRSSLVLQKCRLQRKVLIITLPFLKIPGSYPIIFPKADLAFISFQKHKGAISPNLREEKEFIEISKIENLNQHFKLVEQYWITGCFWPQWQFLENDFISLSNAGFSIKKRDLVSYKKTIKQVSKLFARWIERFAIKNRIESICVYGRGHWSMNAATAVARVLNLPLFVVERGILANTIIVDINMPFTYPSSIFRKNWREFLQINVQRKRPIVSHKDTHWGIYLSYSPKTSKKKIIKYPSPLAIFIGQCLFDLNLSNAPFNDPISFIKLCISRLPGNKWATLIYRPHPLSPEVFKTNKILVDQDHVIIDYSNPKYLFLKNPYIITWNSTLGLEASLFFNCEVQVLDPSCYYKDVLNNPDRKIEFLEFLQEVSIKET